MRASMAPASTSTSTSTSTHARRGGAIGARARRPRRRHAWHHHHRRGHVICASDGEDARARAAPGGYGFSAAGFLFPYHVGAWRALREECGLARDARAPFAGASAGSLVAALHCCGLTPDDGERILMDILADCRANGVVGRVGGVLEEALRRELPANAHELCSRDNLFVSVSTPRALSAGEREEMKRARRARGQSDANVPFLTLDGELISAFESFDDLIGALLASCHIPLYCGWPARRYRGKWCVDGGWFDLAPVPPNVENAVRVCGIPLLDAWRKAGEDDGAFAPDARFWAGWGERPLIAPDAVDGVPELDYKTTITWALFPAGDEELQRLVRLGREDALRWARANGHLIDDGAPRLVAL